MPNKAYSGPDERVRNALQGLDLAYSLSDDGLFSLEFALRRGRTQIVFISSDTTRVGKWELRQVYAYGYTGPDELPPNLYALLLASNSEAPVGSWATFADGGGHF